MRQEYITKSARQTQELGKKIAKQTLKEACLPCLPDRQAAGRAKKLCEVQPRKKAIIIGLKGDLGGGKTTFVQGFAKGLGIKEKILSPTFVILKKFPVKGGFFLYHIDCYRLKSEKDILNLGFKEIICNPRNIIVIEWPEKLKRIIPEDIFLIGFKFVDENKRKIIF